MTGSRLRRHIGSKIRNENLGHADQDDTLNRLFAAADRVRMHAHAPYSRFFVGAALLTSDGKVHTGCNVENSAYPLGICAEASAIAAMIANQGRMTIDALCVVGGPQGQDSGVVMPCGGCRQRIFEFATPQTRLYVRDKKGQQQGFDFGTLLPHAFDDTDLP